VDSGITGATLTPGTRTITLGTRQAVVYVPASYRAGGSGLVALHGNGDTAMNFLLTSGLRGVADAQGVAVVFPVAISGSGPMGVDWDAYTRPATSNRDIVLARAARTWLVAGGVDARRVFLLGYSQGGFLAYHVAMVAAQEFGSASVISASDPLPGANIAASATRRIPIDMLIGTGDFGIANARNTAASLRSLGFDVRLTELPGVGHCCPLSTAGRAADVYAWLSARPLP
jgi:poly(3-hydroxybutyrate) depolymerase